MKKLLNTILHSKTSKRLVSGLTALVMVFGAVPMGDISTGEVFERFSVPSLSVSAETDVTDDDDPIYTHVPANSTKISVKIQDLVAYSEACAKYHKYHKADELTILGSTGDTKWFQAGFKGLGTSTYPFEGSVKIENNANVTLNLDAPLFNYVYDDVVINEGNPINIAREYDGQRTDIVHTTPILAQNVLHRNGQGQKKWKINVSKPSDDANNESYNLSEFGGMIGTMDTGASVTVEASMNTSGSDDAPAVIAGSSALGFACGTMKSGSVLSFSLASDRNIASVSTSSGNVGGLVGTMEANAEFTYSGINHQNPETIINTGNGYAGGVVGSNVGKSVTITLPSGTTTFNIKQYIEGTSGAGGVYGFYSPSADNTINTDFYDIDCLVNGNGYVGGLFGVLDSTKNVTVSGNGTVKTNHTSGATTAYGGLIGQYKADSVSHSLVIGAVTSETHQKYTDDSGNVLEGTSDYYGGGIGIIDSTAPAYVSFTSFNLNKAYDANTLTFGGLVASADNAFVDANNVTIAVDGTFKGGALIGTTEQGVLRMIGSTTMTDAKSSVPTINSSTDESKQVGQLVGYRNNALVFAEADWELSRYTGNVPVDDIGAWGEVLRFSGTSTSGSTSTDGYTTTESIGGTAVLTINESTHAISVESPTSSYTSIGSTAEFAKTALAFQFDSTSFLSFKTSPSSLYTTPISLTGDVILTDTGITGLTRDNDIGTIVGDTLTYRGDKCTYSGTISGGNHQVTLAVGQPYGKNITAHDKEGRGKIYCHAYNGLIGIANNVSFSQVKFSGTMDISARKVLYVGAAAAQAKGSLGASSVETIAYDSTDDSGLKMTIDGSETVYAGRLIGYCTKEIADIAVTSSNFDGKLTGRNSDSASCSSGVIGKIANNSSAGLNWTFTTVYLKGEVSNDFTGINDKGEDYARTQRLGGLIAEISGYSSTGDTRKLTLDGVTIDGLSISGTVVDNSQGGLLGYSWLNTNVDVKSVILSNSPTVSMTGAGATAGLVYRATGHWTVTSLNMTGINMIAPNASSIGMIVNKGISHDDTKLYTEGSKSAIYLELPSGYSFTLTWGSFKNLPLRSSYVFDELCAFSAAGQANIMRNGNGIVSISTAGLTMETTAADSLSYDARTTEGETANPNTRYYYNLDDIDTGKTLSADAAKLMAWGVRQYACQNLTGCFANPSFSNSIPSGTYSMKGYSWYPITIDNNTTVSGAFKLFNKEFELCEAQSANAWSSLTEGTTATQHYMLHNALFYTLEGNKTLNVNSVTLQGNVGKTSDGSGMLICHKAEGSSATKKANVNINGLLLDGAYIHDISSDGSAPLVINNVGNHTNLNVKNVSTKNTYQSMTAAGYPGLLMLPVNTTIKYPKAASSLIGNVGLNDSATGLNVEFSCIRLDGRKTDVDNSNGFNDELNTAYGTNRTIFTTATLLNKFQYDSGSNGKYDYKLNEDWGPSGHHYTEDEDHNKTYLGVTYGAEVGYTKTDNPGTEYPDKEHAYIEGGKYTNPIKNNDSTGEYYANFRSGFLPYVGTGYSKPAKTHQLKINHGATVLSGCGTYNDPYVLTSSDFNTVANIINGGTTGTIILPDVADGSTLLNTDWDSVTISGDNKVYAHNAYKFDDSETQKKFRQFTTENDVTTYSGTGYDLDTVRQYLAHAYYALSDDVEISNDFSGFGSTEGDTETTGKYYFRGVIFGDGHTITNKSNNPLIKYSNGSVVKNVNIVVDTSTSETNAETGAVTTTAGVITLSQNTADPLPTANAYGAVIGQVLGGDNIIDAVSVSFANTTISFPTTNNTYAQLIPVGGYVGVIEKGGVYFRGMSSMTDADIQGLTSTVISSVAETNMQWMYVNPIIGRVINGFAVTESSAYRPFEKGTRTYKGTDAGNTISDNNGAVTMKNGSKHYSIADITTSNSIAMLNTNGTDGLVEVPNGQAFFVMSLIVNSGMSNQSLGYNANNYQASRWASYGDIGPDAVNTAGSDYLIAHADLIQSNTTDKRRGYLMHTYTTGDTDISGATAKSIKLTSTTTSPYYLPDGYKGIGNIFDSDAKYHMTVSLFDGNGATISQNTTYYYYPGFGTNSTSAVNLALDGIKTDTNKKDANFDRFYQPYSVASDDGRGGLGLFNYISYYNSTTPVTATFKNLTLKGNVKTDIIHYSTGEHIPYTTIYLKYNEASQRRILSAGSLIGCYDGNLTLNSVALDDVYVFAPKNSGGILGYFPNNYALTISNTEAGLNSDKIIVESGLNAGGLVGKKQQGTLDFDNANSAGKACSFNITRVASLCTSMTDTEAFYNYGVGGIVGVSRGTNDATAKATLKNFTMGSDSQSALNYVKSETANIYTGGLFGILNRQYLEMDNCTIYNMSVKSQLTAGGVVGQWLTAGGKTTDVNQYTSSISNTKLICNLDDAEISSTGAKFYDKDQSYANVDDSTNMIFCNAGGFIGSAKEDTSKVTIKNSSVEGYKISGKINAGGVAGIWGDDSTKAVANRDGKYNHYLILCNLSVLDCDIKSDTTSGYSGGLVGRINSEAGNHRDTYDFSVSGYNILAQDLSFDGSKSGYICGKMSNYDHSIVKIAGFSRQDTRTGDDNTMIQPVIGDPADSTNIYGNGGYVIFAAYDYNSRPTNNQFSNIITSGENVVSNPFDYSETTISKYTIVSDSESAVSIGNSTPTNAPVEPVRGETELPNPGTYSSIVKVGYTKSRITDAKNLVQITSIAGLTTDSRVSDGFIIKLSNNCYVTNTEGNHTDGDYIAENSTFLNAQIWYLEVVDSNNNTFKLYTVENNSTTKKYIMSPDDNGKEIGIKLTDNSDSADVFTVSYNSSKERFLFENIDKLPNNTHYYLNRSGYAGGLRYDANPSANPTNKDNYYLYFYYAYTPKQFQAVEYPNAVYSGDPISLSGTPSLKSLTAEEKAAIEAEYAERCGDDITKSLYYITITEKVNHYLPAQNVAPYVTTSPKFDISSTQWLTGDGVSSMFYDASVYKQILQDINTINTKVGRYSYATALTEKEQNAVSKHLSNSAKEYNNYSGLPNFPLLVVDDTDYKNITPLINNYLRMLTNTKYSFETDVANVYEVGLHKAYWNGSGFTVDTGTTSGCLQRTTVNSTDYFKMEANNVDTGSVPQFTLMDIKFFDPNETSKIAYHLYVPVYVKKLLQFNFTASLASNTNYYTSAYEHYGNTLFENLGNPVTLKFEYQYTRTTDEWLVSINSGDSVQTNYYKSLILTNQTGSWPANTRMVLVDAANRDKRYYLDSPPSGDSIDLYDFTSDSNRSVHYAPVLLNDLMQVTVAQVGEGETGHLLLTDSEGTSETLTMGTVPNQTTYKATVKGTDGKYYAYYPNEIPSGTTAYHVTAVTYPKAERYYLSIFTPKSNDTSVYHYEISSKESFINTGYGKDTEDVWRANKIISQSQVVHLFIGALYTNDLTLEVAPRKPGIQLMAGDNNFLTVTMTANIGLTQPAKDSGVGTNMGYNLTTSTIYQTFLMTYDMLEDATKDSKIGIVPEAGVSIGDRDGAYYLKAGNIPANSFVENDSDKIDNPEYLYDPETDTYLELRNSENLIEYLADESNQNSVTLRVKYDLVYSASDLAYQFPKKGEGVTDDIGTKVIGYSNISSSLLSTAYSATSKSKEDAQDNQGNEAGTRYYTTDDAKATLEYSVVETKSDKAGPYSYLGKNAIELGNTLSPIDGNAVYDTRMLKNTGDYIELWIELYQKSDSYTAPLDVKTYLQKIKIKGIGNAILYDQTKTDAAQTNATNVVVDTTDGTKLKLRVKKDQLRTNSEGLYLFPISYDVWTGNNKFNSNTDGLMYSNYKVSLTAVIYPQLNGGTYSTPSYATDHIIYTNACVEPNVIK